MVDARAVCALVTYDGTDYRGFQAQLDAPTIQGTLEQAIAGWAKPQSRVSGAGRTDTGVHAAGQVVGVTVGWSHPLPKLQDAWNAHLPSSITVRDVVAAPPGFHPRFSAVSRTYRYTVMAGSWATLGKSPLTDRFATYVMQPLDLAAMQAAAALIVGEHDFATFGQPTQGEYTVRRVLSAQWDEVTESLPALPLSDERRLVLTITANGFLRNMVRCLVGAFLAVGQGIWTVGDVERVLAAANRRYSPPPAPPQGLSLTQVTYPAELDPWGATRAA
jgi:tRNA pseudouridine38-40 synthase